MSLRTQVRTVLMALCEGTGVAECDDGDIEFLLGEQALHVRVYEPLLAIRVYREVVCDVPVSSELIDWLHGHNAGYVVFRAFWEQDSVFLRADIPANPFSAGQLQYVLETFDAEAEELAKQVREWSS